MSISGVSSSPIVGWVLQYLMDDSLLVECVRKETNTRRGD